MRMFWLLQWADTTKENEMSIELPLHTMTVAEKVQLLETLWDNYAANRAM